MRLWKASAQSGPASIAENTYARETMIPTATNRYCTLLYDPSAMNATTTTAATVALIWVGTPKIPSADPMPANSATIEPRFAVSISSAANTVHRTPQRSLMRLISPFPVASPRRAPASWVKNSTIWLARSTHSSSYPKLAPASE